MRNNFGVIRTFLYTRIEQITTNQNLSVLFFDQSNTLLMLTKDFELNNQELPLNLVLELHSFYLAEIPYTWRYCSTPTR